jgi:hypothetical protein
MVADDLFPDGGGLDNPELTAVNRGTESLVASSERRS